MWIARDEDNTLVLWTEKPIRYIETGLWNVPKFGKRIELDNKLFSELKWEDEPVEVEIVVKKDYSSYCTI